MIGENKSVPFFCKNYYCAAEGRYMDDPAGWYGSMEEAERRCEYDHSKDCDKCKS